MAYLVGRACYLDAPSAATAVYSGVAPVLFSGSVPSITSLEFSAGSWSVVTRDSSGVVGTFSAPVPALADCDLAGRVADDISLGALVLIVWAVAWGVLALRRVLS